MSDLSDQSAGSSSHSSCPDEQSSSRVLVSVSFKKGPQDVQEWREWLISHKPSGITDLHLIDLIELEGLFGSHSALGLVSMPSSIWNLLPDTSAYKYIGFVTTPNLIQQSIDKSPIANQVNQSDDIDSAGNGLRGVGTKFKGFIGPLLFNSKKTQRIGMTSRLGDSTPDLGSDVLSNTGFSRPRSIARWAQGTRTLSSSASSTSFHGSDIFSETGTLGTGSLAPTEIEGGSKSLQDRSLDVSQDTVSVCADQESDIPIFKTMVKMVIHRPEGDFKIRLGVLHTGSDCNLISRNTAKSLGLRVEP